MSRRLKTILIVGGVALGLALLVPESAKWGLLSALTPILSGAVIIAFGVYIVSAGVRSAGGRPGTERPRPPADAAPPRARSLTMPDDFGAGRFCISGVDRDTRMDTTWHCTAESEANARVKAELEGIIVTAVERDR